MPTSNGVNPGLTIAANALRVADAVLAAGIGVDDTRNEARRAR
jgi:choline dehydrogenase-like flavoprotein